MTSQDAETPSPKLVLAGIVIVLTVGSTAIALTLGSPEELFSGLLDSLSNLIPGIPAIPALGTLVATFIAVALWDAVKATARNRDKIKGSVQNVLESEDRAEIELEKAQDEAEEVAKDAAERGDISKDTARNLITNAEETKESAEQMRTMISEIEEFSLDTEDKTEVLFSVAVEEASEKGKTGVRDRFIEDFKSGLDKERARKVMELLESERKEVLGSAEEMSNQNSSVRKEIEALEQVRDSVEDHKDRKLLEEVDETLEHLRNEERELAQAESNVQDLADNMKSAEVGIRDALESKR